MIAITGGAGFIGSHLSRRLSQQGREVRILDSFDAAYDPAVKWRNIAAPLKDGRVDLLVGDVRDDAALERLLGDGLCDTVVHLAAVADLRAPSFDAAACFDVNVTGTVRLLEAARAAGVRNLILTSTLPPAGARSPWPFHASQQAMAAAAVAWVGERTEVGVSLLRLGTVYGPAQPPWTAVARLLRAVEVDEPFTVFGDGNARRAYTWIDDVVDALVTVVDRGGRGLQEDVVAHPLSVTVTELVAAVEGALASKVAIEHAPACPAEPLDVERPPRASDLAAPTELGDGIARLIAASR